MKKTLLFSAILLMAGCGGEKSPNSLLQTTAIQGDWTVVLKPDLTGVQTANLEVKLAPYACTIQPTNTAESVSNYTLNSSLCFAANASVGSISGTGLQAEYSEGGENVIDIPQGFLLGSPALNVQNGESVSFVYIDWYGFADYLNSGDVIVLQGSGIVNEGKINGTWAALYNCGNASNPCTGTWAATAR